MRVTLVPPCMKVSCSPVFSMPGVQVADDRLAAQHRLALQLEHQAQHAVRRRVLRTHVDDHRLIVVGVVGEVAEQRGLGLAHAQHGADLAHQFGGGELAARLELLVALVGAGDEPFVAAGAGVAGMRVDRSSCRSPP